MREFLDDFPLGSGRAEVAPIASDSVAQVALSSGTPVRITVPAGARFVAFSRSSADDWVAFGDSAVEASIGSAATAGAHACLNPAVRRIPEDCTHISIVAETATKLSLEFWR